MASKISTSLSIYCFFLIMILVFVSRGLAARILVDTPQNNPSSGDKQDNGQSKGQVNRSHSPHDGSATGDNSPSGTVLMSPPTTVTKMAFAKVTVNGTSNPPVHTSPPSPTSVTIGYVKADPSPPPP